MKHHLLATTLGAIVLAITLWALVAPAETRLQSWKFTLDATPQVVGQFNGRKFITFADPTPSVAQCGRSTGDPTTWMQFRPIRGRCIGISTANGPQAWNGRVHALPAARMCMSPNTATSTRRSHRR